MWVAAVVVVAAAAAFAAFAAAAALGHKPPEDAYYIDHKFAVVGVEVQDGDGHRRLVYYLLLLLRHAFAYLADMLAASLPATVRAAVVAA